MTRGSEQCDSAGKSLSRSRAGTERVSEREGNEGPTCIRSLVARTGPTLAIPLPLHTDTRRRRRHDDDDDKGGRVEKRQKALLMRLVALLDEVVDELLALARLAALDPLRGLAGAEAAVGVRELERPQEVGNLLEVRAGWEGCVESVCARGRERKVRERGGPGRRKGPPSSSDLDAETHR